MDEKVLEKTANELAKYADIDLENKLKPLNKSIDDMLSRLEEYQTMMAIIHKECDSSEESFESITQFTKEVNDLCSRIDSVERLISHIKANLNYLENNLDKAEQELGCGESSSRVTNIFMPLFKKSPEKSMSKQSPNMFRTEDYFDSSTS